MFCIASGQPIPRIQYTDIEIKTWWVLKKRKSILLCFSFHMFVVLYIDVYN